MINTTTPTTSPSLQQQQQSEEEMIQSLEQETMMKELKHLLYNIVPQQWSKIIAEIQLAINHLDGEVMTSHPIGLNDTINNLHTQGGASSTSVTPNTNDTPQQRPITPNTNSERAITPNTSGSEQPPASSSHEGEPRTPITPAAHSRFNASFSKKGTNAERIQLHIVDQNHSILKGYLLVEGYRILGGKVNFKLHKMKNSFEAEIKPNDPYTLSQVQRAHHMADYALNKMKNIDIEKYSENSNIILEGDEDNEVDMNNNSYFSKTSKIERDVTTILSILERVMILVQQGREQLTMYGGLRFLTDEYRLSSSISEKTNIELIQQAFHPRLPKEALVEFSINNAQLHVGVYGISYTSIATSSASQLKNTNMSSESRHRHFITEDNEIGFFSEEYVSKIKVSSFSAGLDHLTNAFKMCSRLRNLLTTHGV
ncbi:hypothetical protein FDP41_008390 [Naegleria fowleri]|uniref:Uncharacterized protein n=1 Tax=Naegleria fowleri TaxID=5763 RepID=A0A6A5B1P3_NAEFO|nr:uncharacterized protein FDP41_008390 [Naegleria fowleri]KAF0973183.1 hypothetical protein FDP41_008390 [Naegleria fowleri]